MGTSGAIIGLLLIINIIAVSIIVGVVDPQLIIIRGEYTIGEDGFINKIIKVAKENI